jgi:hypothetical protein
LYDEPLALKMADELLKAKGIGSSLSEVDESVVKRFKEEIAGYSDKDWRLNFTDAQKHLRKLEIRRQLKIAIAFLLQKKCTSLLVC